MRVGVSLDLAKPNYCGNQTIIWLLFMAAVGCAQDDTGDVDESETLSALDTRYNNGHREHNVARLGTATSSNPTGMVPRHPAWTINDGRRGAPLVYMGGGVYDYAYWNSWYPPTNYNCNYSNQWWVSVKFSPRVGEACLGGNCVRNIREINLLSLQDDYRAGADPTLTTVTRLYTNVHFQLQYCPAGVTCSTNGSGWVVAPGGYIYWNDKAWASISFEPIAATAVRAQFLCAQEQWAYAVELEAWEREPANVAPSCPANTCYSGTCPISPIEQKNVVDDIPPYVGDNNTTASIIADTDRFWWKYFGAGDVGGWDSGTWTSANGVPDDIDNINWTLSTDQGLNQFWRFEEKAAALAQMYDLLAPIDFPRALVYLERLRQMANAFLNNRDDKRFCASPHGVCPLDSTHPRFDPFHGRVMPGWGSRSEESYNQWWAQASMSGLLTYAMGAFARRVADHPDWFCMNYRLDAIKFTTAVLETYTAFRPDMRLSHPDNASWGYYVSAIDGLPESFNLSMYPLRALVEVARAADSELYRTSQDATPTRIDYATREAPLLIAKSVKWFRDDGLMCHGAEELPDPADPTQVVYWRWWHYSSHDLPDISRGPEDANHGQLTLGTLLHIWENRTAIDGLLYRYGYAERVAGPNALTSTLFKQIATTFLRRMWIYDYNSNLKNLITDRIDGPNSGVWEPSEAPVPGFGHLQNGNRSTAGFVPLTQFDPWVWVRSRDSAFNPFLEPHPACEWSHYTTGSVEESCYWGGLTPAGHAAILRYR